MTAPFAVEEEFKKKTFLPSVPPLHEDCVDENAVLPVSPLPLTKERLSRGGLNIFAWNTEPPMPSSARVVRERDERELLRLRPVDAGVQRDNEVREKFSENTCSRFLCFSEDVAARRQQGRRSGGRPTPNVSACDGALGGVDVPGEGPTSALHGRRRRVSGDDGATGIAGFAGMGAGKNNAAPRHLARHGAGGL